jgi:DNA-binding NarL/FixJ family response regulator
VLVKLQLMCPGSDGNKTPPPSVYVLDDVRLNREGLSELLRRSGRVEVVGAGGVSAASLCALSDEEPDVTLIDAPLAGSPAVVRAVLAAARQTKLVAVGVREPENRARESVGAAIALRVGFDASSEDLLDVIAATAKGAASHGVLATLTARESQIALLMAEGLQNKHIAERLSIEMQTVKNHVHSILRKLGVDSRTAATRVVLEHGSGATKAGSLVPASHLSD